ncbi:hypothetical protein FH972_026148 [Carpinus fangiana]|uniref:Major facilitator superfamily (MFS) profile domain-containing protein n=1 Tax=Carpinus fangiana TaxID=176857 RepID=A0A5N6L440_9ROSI|nr:hypothetical protein FH972_026148 [Carpinus fangiana]
MATPVENNVKEGRSSSEGSAHSKPSTHEDHDAEKKAQQDPSPTAQTADGTPKEDLVYTGARSDGKRIITPEECYDQLGFCFPWQKKWTIISVIFLVQMSMNFNSSVYANAIVPIQETYGVSEAKARVSQMLFLVLYGIGCELWAPWSEEFGRWPILQLSLFLVNIWQLPGALAPNLGSIYVSRALGGLSSAGGSVTLGMVADMWEADDQQYAIGYVVLSSVGGSTIGAVFGGLMQDQFGNNDSTTIAWNFWMQLIIGVITQIIHFFLVPETRSTIMMNRIAKKRREAAEKGEGPAEDLNLYGPDEVKKPRVSTKEVLTIWARPFVMFVTEPIVLFLSLLSGFSDALIFTLFEGLPKVFMQYDGFGNTQIGLIFIAVEIGYVLAYLSFFPFIHQERKIRRRDPDALLPERRLLWLLWLAPLETIGLFAFAWTSGGPQNGIPWIVPTIFAGMIGAANYGGNGFARDVLAGISAMYGTPLYTNIGGYAPRTYQYASTILGCLAFVVAIPIYVFYWYGPQIRARSKFAQELATTRSSVGGRRVSSVGLGAGF